METLVGIATQDTVNFKETASQEIKAVRLMMKTVSVPVVGTVRQVKENAAIEIYTNIYLFSSLQSLLYLRFLLSILNYWKDNLSKIIFFGW